MAAGIEIYNYVTNQKGSPALYSDTFANRPAAGFIGRLFVSTDTLEIYRDNGTTWDLISGGGGPSVNIYNSDGTLLADRTMTMAGYNLIFEGGAGTNRVRMSANAGQARIFSFASANVARWAFRVDGAETGSNAGADWALRSYNDAGTFVRSPLAVTRSTGEKSLLAEASLTAGTNTFTGTYQIGGATYAAGLTMIGGNPHGAEHNNFTLANAGNLTFANSIYLGAQSNVLRLQANNSGTVTMQAASPGIRTAAGTLNQVQYNTTTGAALTYTHVSVMQALGIYRLFAAGSLTVTNGYGLIINDLNEYGYAGTGAGALSITNRWGIYQDSTTDVNYLGGTTLVGTTTNAGYKFDINGTLRAVNTVTFGSLSGTGTRMVVADASGVLSTQAIPGGGGISGSGTTNYVAKFTSASAIGNSSIFDNGTNVGINTATPVTGSILDITGSSNVYPRIRSTGANEAFLFFQNSTSGTGAGDGLFVGINSSNDAFFYNAENTPIRIFTNSVERLRVTSTGEFLVGGTYNPYAVAGRTIVALNGTNSQLLQFSDNTAVNGYIAHNNTSMEILQARNANLQFFTFSLPRFTITGGGNHLMGTTTDSGQTLQVAGTARIFGTTSPHLLIEQTGATGNATIEFKGPNNYPAIINYGTNMGGLLIQGSGTTLYNFATDGNFTIGNAGVPGFPTNTVTIKSGTAPSSSSVDTFTMYAADITAGNAAAHFRSENGAVIKLYQETTSVAAATFAANTGTAVNDASTFDGYTLNQIVKALRNLGILA
jgi:heat shock protein HslJ